MGYGNRQKEDFCPSQPQKMTRVDACGRSPGLTSSYSAPSRLRSGRRISSVSRLLGQLKNILDSLLCLLAPSRRFDYFHYKPRRLILQGDFWTFFLI